MFVCLFALRLVEKIIEKKDVHHLLKEFLRLIKLKSLFRS